MRDEKIIAEMKALAEKIEYHSEKYYVLDAPEIEDFEYDALFERLKTLEAQYPHLASPVSPTKRVGGSVSTGFQKVKHEAAMGSLTDVFNIESLRAFDARVKELCPRAEYVTEYKIDGLSVSLEYINGVFVTGATRGDGVYGEDVTENIKTIKSVPLVLKGNFPERLIVRGEVYMPKKVFASINEKNEENGKKLLANPRNAAAGALRRLDSSQCAENRLDIFVFNLQYSSENIANSHREALDLLEKFGFIVSPRRNVYGDIEDVINEIEAMGSMRDLLQFGIDGAVVKVDSFAMRSVIGETTSVPKWAVAYKYPAEIAQTIITDIQIQVGRTGVLTPKAVLEPVKLAGTTVSHATLHNIDYIKERDIRIGDTAILQKGGDIIPAVMGIVLEKRRASSITYEMPSACPSCGDKVTREEGEAAVRCTNALCPAQLQRNITHFVSRDAMNIDSMGESVVSKLIESKLINDVSDLYYLQAEDIARLEGLGAKSATNIIASIEKSKKAGLAKLIFALGIRHIGEKAGAILASHFGSMDALMNAAQEELCTIDEIGAVSAASVNEFFAHSKTKSLIARLEAAGVVMIREKTEISNALEGKTFVVTGTLPTLKRNEAKALITNHGGSVSSSVSKKTSYLVCGEAPGSKLEKANSLGVPVISEKGLFDLLSQIVLTYNK